ncbi:MAG: hypothetical protein KatS3mg056_3805 [Chloroflexus sp.]|jgi:hypothetical protein|nr:MAG: hypothetical protein KatS3mg056_3805 [Chloroflexus sp.]
MIAIGAGLSDWPGGSAPLQPCQHVLGGLLYPLVMHVSRGVECDKRMRSGQGNLSSA